MDKFWHFVVRRFKAAARHVHDDIRVIALCMLAALVFWLLNALNKDYSAQISYPIRFEYDSSRYMAVSPLPRKITMRVYGYGWDLMKKVTSLDNPPIIYHLKTFGYNNYVTAGALLPAAIEYVKGVRINYVIEDTLFLDISRRSQRQIRLVADTSNLEVAPGYQIVGPLRLQPDQVLLKGPESELRKLKNPLPVPVSLRVATDAPFERDFGLPLGDYVLVEAATPSVRVSFEVAAVREGQLFVPIRIVNLPPWSRVRMAQQGVLVRYESTQAEAAQIHASDFSVEADFKNFNSTDSAIRLRLSRQSPAAKRVRLAQSQVRLQHEK